MKKIPWIILSRMLGLVVFLVLLGIVNLFADFVDSPVFLDLVWFLNNNAGLLVIMSLLFMFGELCFELFLPFNLPGPLFNAFGAVFLVRFIFSIFRLIDQILGLFIFRFFTPLGLIIYPFVFLAVLFGGYITLFTRRRKEHLGKDLKKKIIRMLDRIKESLED